MDNAATNNATRNDAVTKLAGLLASKYGVNAMDMNEEDMETVFLKNNWELPEKEKGDDIEFGKEPEEEVEEEQADVEETETPLEERTEDELREIAKDQGIRGYHNMKKETLLKKLA